MRFFVIFMGILCAAVQSPLAGALVPKGDTWRVYKGTNMPPTQGGVDWTSPLYVHESWLQLASGFGMADGDDASVLTDMQNNYASIFVRKRLVITNAAAITHLSLAVDYDDGFVAYLNGTEIARGTMAPGAVSNTTLANGFHGSSHEDTSHDSFDKEFYAIDPGLLFNGTNNVLAISGHNQTLGSSDFSLIAELYTNIGLVRGPMVQMPDTNGVTIAWRTDALTDSVVDYGFTTNYLSGTVSNGTPVFFHDLKITNVAPGTGYFYRVRSGGVTLSEGNAFRTRAAVTQAFRCVVYGDFGGGPGATNIAARINATNVDFAITVGDNIYDNGQPGDYDAYWFQPYAPTMRRSATFPALGNHDNHVENRRWMATNFFLPTNGPISSKELIYSYDFGNAHFAVIDSDAFDLNVTAIENETKLWLSNDLASTPMPWKIVVFHHPPYTSQGSHADNEAMKADISPILEKYGVQLVLQGHNHFFERINPVNGVNYITSGGGGRSLYGSISVRKNYSATLMYNQYSYSVLEIRDRELALRGYNQSGALFDQFRLSLGHPFLMDGRIDNPAWMRASNGLALYAVVRSNYLYVATQDAGEGNDHFIYLADQMTTSRPVNWAKSGTIVQWSAFLADENDNAVNGWYGASEQPLTNYPNYRAVTTALNNNGTNGNGVLEGSIDLAAHFGAFPPEIFLAGAPYGTANGGALVASSQVPAGNGSANISAGEFLDLNTRDIALDLPVADAGTNQQMDADDTITLNGSGSTSPSGFNLSYLWSQVSGPVGLITSPTGITTSFQFTNNVASSTTVVFRLVVNDTRFNSTDTVAVAVTGLEMPVANAGPDQAMDWTDTNTLDASASTVEDGFELSYLWTQIAGPAAYVVSPTGMGTDFYFTNNILSSTVTFKLVVNDTRFESTDTVSVAVSAPEMPVANAGPNQFMFSTDTNTLDGSASTVADGYELSYLWTQLSGPTAFIESPTGMTTAFYFTDSVESSTNATFQLLVNDTRFDSTDTVSVAVTVLPDPFLDSDGDGLSDLEELTGIDDPSTFPDPNGHITNPLASDSDGDGFSDAAEAIAGTDPNNPADYLKVNSSTVFSTNLIISWPSASNRAYTLNAISNIGDAIYLLVTNIFATPPLNSQTVPVDQANHQFYYIEVEQP